MTSIISNKLILYNLDNQEMLQAKKFKHGVANHTLCIVNNMMIIIGGVVDKNKYIEGFYIQDLSKTSYEDMSPDQLQIFYIYLIVAGCIVVLGSFLCCSAYLFISVYARVRDESAGYETNVPKNVPQSLLVKITKSTYKPV